MSIEASVQKEKKKNKMLHPLVLIFFVIVVASLLTYVVPAGVYDMAKNEATGRMAVVPGSYHHVDPSPVTLGTFLLSFQKGMKSASTVVGFLLLIGGAFGIVNATGAIEALMAKFIVKFKSDKSKNILIAGLIFFFGICAGSFGMAMESLVFAPFLMALMMSLGYDALVGVSIPILGTAAGYGAAFLNPFTVGIAHSITELPMFSGMAFRVAFFIIIMIVVSLYVINYAKKIKADPTKSYCYGNTYDFNEIKDPESIKLNSKQIRVLVVFVGSILFLMYGAIFKDFFMNECATLFLFMGIIAGIVYGMNINDIAENFVDGAKTLVFAALLVGFARGITVVLQSANIMDSIIYYSVQPLKGMPSTISASFMVLIQTGINFFISSGSGQSMVTMPIMTPIADLLNVNRQVAVLAFQTGDGFSNMFWVTGGTMIAGIAMAKISYGKWIKFAWKLFVILLVLSMAAVSMAQLINWGPF